MQTLRNFTAAIGCALLIIVTLSMPAAGAQLSIAGPSTSQIRFYEGGSTLATLASDNTLSVNASQELPVTISVKLTAEQVEALKAEFGAKADLESKTQAWVNDWLIQFVSKLEEKQKRELFDALKAATPADAAVVRERLKIKGGGL